MNITVPRTVPGGRTALSFSSAPCRASRTRQRRNTRHEFGRPNNPYGPPQGQPAGYPPRASPATATPRAPRSSPSGLPQAPPIGQQRYGGYPGGAMEMPGTVKAARVMLFVIGGLQVLGAVLIAISALAVSAAKNNADLKNDVQFQQLADYWPVSCGASR